MKKLSIMVGVPSGGMWHEPFALSLLHLMLRAQGRPLREGWQQEIRLCSNKGSLLGRQRAEIVQRALEARATHLLFVDSDQTFPSDTLERLLAHEKAIVAANIATKQIPASPTARQKGMPPVPVFTDPHSTGLEKVWRVGTGIMLIDMQVFHKIGPHVFNMFYREDVGTEQGEDWSLCEAAEKAGFEIFIDHDLSKEVGHLGIYSFTHDVVGEVLSFPGAI